MILNRMAQDSKPVHSSALACVLFFTHHINIPFIGCANHESLDENIYINIQRIHRANAFDRLPTSSTSSEAESIYDYLNTLRTKFQRPPMDVGSVSTVKSVNELCRIVSNYTDLSLAAIFTERHQQLIFALAHLQCQAPFNPPRISLDDEKGLWTWWEHLSALNVRPVKPTELPNVMEAVERLGMSQPKVVGLLEEMNHAMVQMMSHTTTIYLKLQGFEAPTLKETLEKNVGLIRKQLDEAKIEDARNSAVRIKGILDHVAYLQLDDLHNSTIS